MFGKIKSALAGHADGAALMGMNALLNGKVREFVNGKVERYGEVKSLRKDEEGYHALVQLLGSDDILEVSMLSLTLNEDCSAVSLGAFTANRPWLENLLEDYAHGREIAIPEGMVREALKKVPKKYL